MSRFLGNWCSIPLGILWENMCNTPPELSGLRGWDVASLTEDFSQAIGSLALLPSLCVLGKLPEEALRQKTRKRQVPEVGSQPQAGAMGKLRGRPRIPGVGQVATTTTQVWNMACGQYSTRIKKKKSLFLAAPSLHCCVWAFSSCSEQGLLSCCSASFVAEYRLNSEYSSWGLWAPEHRINNCGTWA